MTPGHTPGCITWTTRVGKRDVVFVGSSSVPSEYRLVGNPLYPNAVEDYRASFRKLKSLPVDVFLASHGNFFGLAEMIAKKKPFAGEKEYREFVEASEKRFESRSAGVPPAAARASRPRPRGGEDAVTAAGQRPAFHFDDLRHSGRGVLARSWRAPIAGE
jgi:metallo-beta-lactamase class B